MKAQVGSQVRYGSRVVSPKKVGKEPEGQLAPVGLVPSESQRAMKSRGDILQLAWRPMIDGQCPQDWVFLKGHCVLAPGEEGRKETQGRQRVQVWGGGAGTCMPMRCTPSGHLKLARSAPH